MLVWVLNTGVFSFCVYLFLFLSLPHVPSFGFLKFVVPVHYVFVVPFSAIAESSFHAPVCFSPIVISAVLPVDAGVVAVLFEAALLSFVVPFVVPASGVLHFLPVPYSEYVPALSPSLSPSLVFPLVPSQDVALYGKIPRFVHRLLSFHIAV